MTNIIKHTLHCVTVLTVVAGGNVHADEWMDCAPSRVAARSYGDIHIGCTNVKGWYFIKSTPNNKDFIERTLYLGTSAIIAGKPLQLLVPKPGQDGQISAIELFK